MRLHTHEWGDGPALVCVHGVTGHGRRFRRLAEEGLPDRRVVAVDLRGHGFSGWEPPWDLGTHVADLVETADHLGIERATWLGFSLGGRLTAELALAHPDRVHRHVLLDPALQLPVSYARQAAEDELRDESWGSTDEAIGARAEAGALISTPREFLEEEMSQHLARRDDGRLAYRYSHPAAIVAWSEMARPAPAVADVPTLMLLATESQVRNEENVRRYRAALGDRFEVEEMRASHQLIWDAFEQSAEAIRRFA